MGRQHPATAKHKNNTPNSANSFIKQKLQRNTKFSFATVQEITLAIFGMCMKWFLFVVSIVSKEQQPNTKDCAFNFMFTWTPPPLLASQHDIEICWRFVNLVTLFETPSAQATPSSNRIRIHLIKIKVVFITVICWVVSRTCSRCVLWNKGSLSPQFSTLSYRSPFSRSQFWLTAMLLFPLQIVGSNFRLKSIFTDLNTVNPSNGWLTSCLFSKQNTSI